MTTFAQFCARSKMRYDFGDKIQVRYHHRDGKDYDTWVSGEEVLQRLRSASAERRLRALRHLDWDDVREAKEQLPEEGKKRLHDLFRDRLGDAVEGWIGGNIIGDSLAEAARGHERPAADEATERWRQRLHEEPFRALVLELAWIQLRGSFPGEAGPADDDGWV
jgi:hypothetical protein